MERKAVTLTRKQIQWIEVALRLRAEASEENIGRVRGEAHEARYWRSLQKKFAKLACLVLLAGIISACGRDASETRLVGPTTIRLFSNGIYTASTSTSIDQGSWTFTQSDATHGIYNFQSADKTSTTCQSEQRPTVIHLDCGVSFFTPSGSGDFIVSQK